MCFKLNKTIAAGQRICPIIPDAIPRLDMNGRESKTAVGASMIFEERFTLP